MQIIKFTLVLVAIINSVFGDGSVTVDINYGGCGYCDLCGNSQYNLNNGNSGCNVVSWNNGQVTFTDPIPSGNSITGVTISTTRMYWCSFPTTVVPFYINGVSIGTASHAYDCSCETCPSVSTVGGSVSGLAGYNYGGSNVIRVNDNSNAGNSVVGVGDISITFTYASNVQTPSQLCNAQDPSTWPAIDEAYYCYNSGQGFVQCWGEPGQMGSAYFPCPAGTTCGCADGVECSDATLVSPCV